MVEKEVEKTIEVPASSTDATVTYIDYEEVFVEDGDVLEIFPLIIGG